MSVIRDLQQRLFELIEPTVERLDCELVAVEATTVDGRRTIRVSIDREGGVNMENLSQANRALSALLDVEDPIEGAYDLEVSSPGLERPVQRWDDFRRLVGFRARIQLDKEFPGRRRYTGDLQGAADEQISIEVDGQLFEVPFDRIERANLILQIEETGRLMDAMRAPLSGEE